MSVLGGAGRGEITVNGSDAVPFEDFSRYPLPGFTLRNRTPPRALTCCFATLRPRALSNDAGVLGARPVAETCSTLPCAVNAWAAEGAAVAPVSAIAAMTIERRSCLSTPDIEACRTCRRSQCVSQGGYLTHGCSTGLAAGRRPSGARRRARPEHAADAGHDPRRGDRY